MVSERRRTDWAGSPDSISNSLRAGSNWLITIDAPVALNCRMFSMMRWMAPCRSPSWRERRLRNDVFRALGAAPHKLHSAMSRFPKKILELLRIEFREGGRAVSESIWTRRYEVIASVLYPV